MGARTRHRAGSLILIPVACFALPAMAGDVEYLKKNERFCDLAEAACLRGTIVYRVNERLIELNARVERADGPGTLRIGLSGENRQGHRRMTSIETVLDGHASEIVSVRMIPDAPDVYSWKIDSILFTPD